MGLVSVHDSMYTTLYIIPPQVSFSKGHDNFTYSDIDRHHAKWSERVLAVFSLPREHSRPVVLLNTKVVHSSIRVVRLGRNEHYPAEEAKS